MPVSSKLMLVVSSPFGSGYVILVEQACADRNMDGTHSDMPVF